MNGIVCKNSSEENDGHLKHSVIFLSSLRAKILLPFQRKAGVDHRDALESINSKGNRIPTQIEFLYCTGKEIATELGFTMNFTFPKSSKATSAVVEKLQTVIVSPGAKPTSHGLTTNLSCLNR